MSTRESTEDKSGKEQKRIRKAPSRRRPVGERTREPQDIEENTDVKKSTNPRNGRARIDYKAIPIPPELIGSQTTGKVFEVIKRYSANYGFISVDIENATNADKPKLYFNSKDYENEEEYPIRRGYEVMFTIIKDDQDRPYASQMSLTEEGRIQAAAREEKIAASKAAEAAASSEGKSKGVDETKEKSAREPRKPRERPPPNESGVNLVVQSEGKEAVTIEAKLYQSIGKFKYSVVEKLGVPLNYIIYVPPTPEEPTKCTMLNKSLLRGMKDGDVVIVGPPKEDVAGEA